MRSIILRIAAVMIKYSPKFLFDMMLGSSEFLKRLGSLGTFQKELRSVEKYSDRSLLFQEVAKRCGGRVNYFEFGVFQGESMNIAIQAFGDKLENAFGFDSFEGLPEDWKHAFGSITKKGTFNVNGQTPDIDNTNVKFVKGWFEDTLPNFLRDNADLFSNDNDVVVHLDADLYGPSVFVLGGIGLLSNRFFVLCDEWTGGESEAVLEFSRFAKFSIEFIGLKENPQHKMPIQVAMLLTR